MTTDKKNIQALVAACRIKGIQQVVFSPGSRSAPLVIGFSQVRDINCTVIADERVAGFFALGMAQQSKRPVAVVCTSGTAVLNLAPAICEAYYQQVPLLMLTADRPPEYIGIGENQAIVQTDIYRNYIKASYTLPEDYREAAITTAQAIDMTITGYSGPVHINIPLREPLYGRTEEQLADFSIPDSAKINYPPTAPIALSERNMIICGINDHDAALEKVLHRLSLRDDCVVVAEPLSNMPLTSAVRNIDSTMAVINPNQYAAFAPQTVITIGRQIVSKRLRQYLHQVKPAQHYHISTDMGQWNGLGAASYTHVPGKPANKLMEFIDIPYTPTAYGRIWAAAAKNAMLVTKQYAKQAAYSDWCVFDLLIQSFPEGASIQYGNSSPIRYAGLFEHHASLSIYANRGTSGIDGCLSTAAGAAAMTGQMTICLLGDVSFLYDSNALWNNALSPHLRIIVINNSGGNIFRLIEGPDRVEQFSKFFETKHNLSAEYLAQMYQIPYYFCDRADDMGFVLGQFYKPQKGNRPAIIEIKTNNEVSAAVYKQYFESLRNNS